MNKLILKKPLIFYKIILLMKKNFKRIKFINKNQIKLNYYKNKLIKMIMIFKINKIY